MSDRDTDNVIDFAAARANATSSDPGLGLGLDISRTESRHKKLCSHKHVEVGDRDAYCGCSDCGAQLSPIEVLRQFAIEERNFWFTNERARDELAAITKRVESLKAEEKRLKARIKRAQTKLRGIE